MQDARHICNIVSCQTVEVIEIWVAFSFRTCLHLGSFDHLNYHYVCNSLNDLLDGMLRLVVNKYDSKTLLQIV